MPNGEGGKAALVVANSSRFFSACLIANSRLIALDETGVTFRVKDYRRNGQERYRTMMLEAGEFIRRSHDEFQVK